MVHIVPSYAYPVDRAHQILSTLPPTSFAFAYGSAIMPQVNSNPEKRMIDLMVAVDDAEHWHKQNLRQNCNHYSLQARLLGALKVAAMQKAGAAVYFNTLIQSKGLSFKYGVVSTADLIRDLTEWDSLYVSGRLHKPVRVITSPGPLLTKAMSRNVEAAAAAALLTLPESFDEERFYNAVASLSYTKDLRMSMAVEVKSKVRDIVRANLHAFRRMYCSCDSVADVVKGGVWKRDTGADAQLALLQRLPKRIREVIRNEVGVDADSLPELSSGRIRIAVLTAVGAVVARSSLSQAVKGVASAGLTTSVRYVAAKIGKSLRAAWR